MATYKVIQDIEADDKLLGPLSLKQFIYFSITCICLYLTFLFATKGAPFVGVILLPPAAFFGVLAFPWSSSQPTEVWLLAKVRFFFKPRRRIWDQAGIKELVTITVPKKVERHLTDGLDQRQVLSRLDALAKTVDSRGWAVKQLNAAPFGDSTPSSDRLTVGTETTGSIVVSDVSLQDDVLDERNNPTAQKIDQMITKSTAAHQEQLRSQLAGAGTQTAPQNNPSQNQPADYWFMHQNDPGSTPAGMATGQGSVVAPHSDSPAPTSQPTQPAISKEDEAALLDKIKSSQARRPYRNTHQKNITPISEQKKQNKINEISESKPSQAEPEVKQPNLPSHDPAILGLSQNDDLNIETIARQANKPKEQPPDEVVINLH